MKLDPKALDTAYEAIRHMRIADKSALAGAIHTYLSTIAETHVVVPRIETDEMCEAGLEALRENLGHSSIIMRDAAACYRAMVHAASQQGGE